MFTNYKALRHVPQADIDVFIRVYKIASLVGDYESTHPQGKRPGYRCHSACRALARHLPELTVVDGHHFGVCQVPKKSGIRNLEPRYYPHSWLRGPKGSIIDPYPVGGISQPMLVPTRGRWAPFGSGLYLANGSLTPKFTKPKILRETEVLVRHIGRLLAKSKNGASRNRRAKKINKGPKAK